MIIAIDFDGTIVKHRFPHVGDPVPYAIGTMKELQELGHQLMLWTVRDGEPLIDAVNYLHSQHIQNMWINNNTGQRRWSNSKKQHADIYIDDLAFGTPLIEEPPHRPYVDWLPIRKYFKLEQ